MYARIADMDTLRLAFAKARRGKQDRQPSGRRPCGANRVIRGGSWNSNSTAINCRSANRNNNTPGNTNNNNGFRVVLAPALTDAADGWVDENRRPVQVGGGDVAGQRDGVEAGAGRGGGCRRRTPRPRRLHARLGCEP